MAYCNFNPVEFARSPLPPITGSLVFSDRDTTVASWVGHRTNMSRKLLWGATTSTGASFRSARRPFTLTHRKPTEKKTARLSSQTMGWRSQRRQPVTGRERSSSDRPANRSRARGQTMRKKRDAKVMRRGKRMLPKMMPWEGWGEGWDTVQKGSLPFQQHWSHFDQ